MNLRVHCPALLACGCVVVGWIAWTSARQARAAEVARAEIATEIHRLKAEMAEHERRRTAAGQAAAVMSGAVVRGHAAPGPTTTAAAAPKRKSNSIADLIRDDPEGQVLYLATQRATLQRRYAPLFRALNLGRDHVAVFQENLFRRDERRMDLQHVVDDGADAGLRAKLQREITADYEAAQRRLLGDAGFAQLREYERTSWIRGVVSSIAGVAAVQHVPFTPLQAEQLVQVIAGASVSYVKGGYAATNEVDWTRVVEQARTLLSPAQFEVFSTMDPGPSTPGILQTRMYALVERAVEQERSEARSAPASPRG